MARILGRGPAGWLLERLGWWLACYLNQPVAGYQPFAVTPPERLAQVLQPADVLLVEGELRISATIKYLTQSTWSHAALYVGDAVPGSDCGMLIEADLEQGVIAVPLEKYRAHNTRICRPVGLLPEDREKVIAFVVGALGQSYDLKNVIDLVRYVFPVPPIPHKWRRRMLALGSGDPTRAICSSLLAQASQQVRYPILPQVECCPHGARRELLHIRHHSLFAPRDFDLSPWFRVVKPTLELGFDYRRLEWAPPD